MTIAVTKALPLTSPAYDEERRKQSCAELGPPASVCSSHSSGWSSQPRTVALHKPGSGPSRHLAALQNLVATVNSGHWQAVCSADLWVHGLGDLAPVSGLLFTSPTPGFINFAFYDTTSSNPTALAPGQSSLFIFLDTDATHYAKTAFVDVASIGTFFASNEIATFAPSAVPELSTWAMMLAGFAGLGFAGYRTSRKSAEIAA